MEYSIQLTEHAERDLSKLGLSVAKRITNKLKQIRASENPMFFAKALTGELKGFYRFRIGDDRAVFRQNSDGSLIILLILRIKHRKKVYE